MQMSPLKQLWTGKSIMLMLTIAGMHTVVIQVKVFGDTIMSAERQHAGKARRRCTFITRSFANL